LKVAIISLALPDSLLWELDRVVEDEGYSSRSEVVRASLRSFLSKRKWLTDLKGSFIATLMFTYLKGKVKADVLDVLKHEFDDVIATEVHMHLEEENCLEILVIKGKGERIKELTGKLSTLRGIEQVEVMTIPLRSEASLINEA